MSGAVRDLVMLCVMCLVLYCTGLDTHGVTNWQEAQRVVVAREMQQRAAAGHEDAWIVPRHNGQAYIAKPPLIYWVTVGLAEARGGEVELFDLRLAVALAGTLGVLGTYVVARSMLRPLGDEGGIEGGAGFSHVQGARWAAVFLATGVLYFRSSRIGELDILLVPSVVGAVGCIWLAWRAHLVKRETDAAPDWLGRRAHWLAVGGAAMCASVAALTKGPPALMVIASAGYGSVLWWAATEQRLAPALSWRARWVWGLVGGGLFAAVGAARVSEAGEVLGVLLLGAIGWLLGAGVGRLTEGARWREAWLGLAATHPVVVLGAPAAVFWVWARGVSERIGSDLALELARAEADNDLNLFMPSSPLTNLEALAYGCGVGSVLMLVAAVWWVKFRPSCGGRAGVLVAVAWVVLSFCGLSLFGKGVARYLTPVWPGVAIIGAAWVVRRREPFEAQTPNPMGAVTLAAVCAVLGAGQTWWYARGREAFEHERSPRAMMAELLQRPEVEGIERFASFEFYTPALDYYAGSYVQPLVNAQMGRAVAGGPAWPIEEFAAHVRQQGPVVVLCRDRSLAASASSPMERMRALGLVVEPIPLSEEATFRIDNRRTVVRAARVSGGKSLKGMDGGAR